MSGKLEPSAPVDLVINAFERNYRDVLARESTFPRIVEQTGFPFARRVALINNVRDRADADRRASALAAAGELDGHHHVADHAQRALERVGLTLRELGSTANFTLPPLVAATLPGSPWLVYWDPDVQLVEPCDWITPSLRLLERDRRVLAANPRWASPKLEPEWSEVDGDFALGHGFSDHVFLAGRADLARPIYRQRCIIRRRYPLAHAGYIFEARVDAHLRHAGRLRATYLPAAYLHDDATSGSAYPRRSLPELARAAFNRISIEAVRRLPRRPGCCVYLSR